MPLQVICSACNAKLRAPDTAAGKKTKCPKCQAVIAVPVDAPQAPAASASAIKRAENWHMQATDGSQYGPVPKSELDEWFKEGRIAADCQLLKEGSDQWQWASEVYPSLGESAATAIPSKPAGGFDFLGPAATTNQNDPLGLGGASPGGAAPLPSLPAPSYSSPAPSFPSSAPTFGGAPSYAAYSAPVTNPYSSPSSAAYGASYGGSRRTGLHPMVVIAAILEFLAGGAYLLGAFGFGLLMIVFLTGGATMANIPAENKDAEAAKNVMAALAGMGALCFLPFLILFLGLCVLMIYTGLGLLKKRFWAKIVAIVLAILHLMPQLLYCLAALLNLEPCTLLGSLVGIALNALILVAMFLPDCTGDFS